MECSVNGCGNDAHARGYCVRHYGVWRRHGDPTRAKFRRGISIAERFMQYVKQSSGCWEWQGYRDPNGYGRLNIRQPKKTYVPKLAHRISWELFRGAISPEQHVCHKCDNPSCVNPEHLFLGDAAINCEDKIAKGRMRFGVSRGEAHGCAKLTEDQVRAIRASTGPSRIAAEKYGVSGRQVRDIRNRRVWRHII